MNTTTSDERSAPRASNPRARFAAALRLAAVAGALALGPPGRVEQAPPGSVALPQAQAQAQAQARGAHAIERATGVNVATAQFIAFALNALLVPLIDDDLPPRWADPSLSFDCEAGAVTVDGAPLDIGARVPQEAFTVRWHMERCAPFDDAMELTGDIELRVEPGGGGYRAVVQPARLHVVSARGDEVLTEAFAARMGVGR